MISFLKFFSRKKEDEQHSALLSSLAVQPASVNVTLLLDHVRKTFSFYLTALHNLDKALLPAEKMEEEFYYETVRQIDVRSSFALNQEKVQIFVDNVQLENYDNTLLYAVRSIIFRATFRIQAGDPEVDDEHREIKYAHLTFMNDSRMGWLLSAVVFIN